MKPVSKSILQETAKLKQKKFRDIQKQYLVSGLNAVQGALDSAQEPLAVFLMQGREDWLEELPRTLQAPLYSVTEKEFRYISDEKNPQGIALLMERPQANMDDLQPADNTLLYLEAVNDPGNLGTIIRSALWFGVDTILLSSGSADPYQPKVVRASAGTVAQVHLYEHIGAAELKRLKNEKNVQIAATVVSGGVALNVFNSPPGKALLLALGSEAHGLSKEIRELSDIQVTIPKKGRVESLNLAISAALCLYEITREK